MELGLVGAGGGEGGLVACERGRVAFRVERRDVFAGLVEN